jgi:glycosyltransferase involved in cell wall biosynthesis
MHIAISYRYNPHYQNDYLENELRRLGHTVTFIGPPASQKAGFDPRAPLTEVLASLRQPPDLYLCIDPSVRYFPPGIEDLPIPTVCWLGDIHLGHWRKQVARFFDLVLVPHKDYLPEYRTVVRHSQVQWLPLYMPPSVQPQANLPRLYDVAFVGNIVRAHRKTKRAERLRLLEQRYATNDLHRLYTQAELSRIYSQARIVFNITINGDVNLRLFEGTACGALVLNDSTANGLPELFEVGRELVVYHDDQDLFEKIDYYLAHDAERSQIAQAGQQRTLRDHTFARRAQTLSALLLNQDIQRCAPMRTAGAPQRLAARWDIYTHQHMLDPILDEARLVRYNPLRRLIAVLPALTRRLLM